MGGGMSFPIVRIPLERVVIVTGGNSGIGYETAKWIAMMGAKVIIACRSEERANQAIEQMNKEFEKEKSKGRTDIVDYDKLCVENMIVDLASLKSTMQFIEKFKATGQPLHVLICNAGLGLYPQSYTEDDYEMMFQVNYLSHFLMASHFLPIMRRSGEDCRIINVSSRVHVLATFDQDTIQGKNVPNFGRMQYYARSKIYQIMQMYSMARRLAGSDITICSLHPGLVQTDLTRNFEDIRIARFGYALGRMIHYSRTPFEGAKTTINAAVNPELKGVSGVYYDSTKPATPSSVARNEKDQEALWKYTLECLKNYLDDETIECLEGKAP